MSEKAPGRMKRLQDDRTELEQLTGRMATLLSATANVLKGRPPQNMIHDWSDLPYVAKGLIRRSRACTCGAFDGYPER